MLATLVGQVLGSGEGNAGGDDAFDGGVVGLHPRGGDENARLQSHELCISESNAKVRMHTIAGSLASQAFERGSEIALRGQEGWRARACHTWWRA